MEDYNPSYKTLDMTPFDDKNTILYQYVYHYKLPKSFFALINGKVYNIYDLLNHRYDQYFDPLDSLMIFYEYAIKIDKDYKQWIIYSYKKIKNIANLSVYDVNDIIETYGDDKIVKYFKNQKVIYYDGDIDELFKMFNRKKDVKILDLLLTERDYQFALYQIEITPDQDLLNLLNQFKYKYKSLKNIKYDSRSFITAYHEWIIDSHRQYTKDLKIATLINDIQSLFIKNNLAYSPKVYDHLVKIYNPFLLNRKNIPIDIYDGLDLFNDAILSSNTPFLIYKDYKGTQYYKVYENAPIIDTTINYQDNSLNYTMINQNKRYDITYNLNDNALQLSYTHYKNTPSDKTIFPTLDIGNVIDYNIEGHFHLWDIEIDEAKLLPFILNDQLINKILFVDEHGKFIFKKSISLKYIPLETTTIVNIELTQLFYNDDKVVDTQNGKVKLQKKKRNYIPYIQVKFKNVYDEKAFTSLITSLLNPYKTSDNILNQLLLNLDYKKEKDLDENLKKLKDLAPDAFVEGYANFCDIKKRPMPIETEEIENYIKNKISEYGLKGEEAKHYRNNAVLKFSVQGEILNLVCDHPDDRYPYLKSTINSKKLSALNKDVYEELPCCKKIAPKATKTIKKEATHLTSTSIISNPGSTGEIDPNIKYLLQNYNSANNHFMRLGITTPGNPYSFIHCLALATDDSLYINTKNKDQYVNTILTKLKSICIVTKQELYDMSLTEIEKSLDTDFFDPDLYYRLLEEYYNVNIYVFNTNLIVPRFKDFHTRPMRDKPTVLIYKNEKQCELIINVLSETHKMLIFDMNMSKYCHDFLQHVLNTYTFSNDIKTYHHLYYLTNHLKIIPNIISQYIDDHGKMRALTVKVNNKLMSLLTLPSQPENLPVDLTIHTIDVKDALSLMTQPYTGVTVSNDLVTGLWFRIYDVEFGEYIPIIPTKDIKINKIGPNNVLIHQGSKVTGQYTFMKKILNRLLQVIQWLFLVAVYKYNTIDEVDDFFYQYVTYVNKDSFIYNDLIDIPRRLPVYETFNYYFDYIAEYCPALVKNNKLIMYNEDFYNKVKEHLRNFHLSDNDIPIFIRDYYQYVSDFKTLPNALIFLNDETLNAWQENYSKIYYFIIDTIYPYIYKLNTRMFIIQNVENNHLDKALSVCDYWHKHQINIGFKGYQVDVNHKNINIYKVNDLQQLELVQVGTDPLNQYHVLDYNYRSGRIGSSKYAAMLPLL